jgi:hypothetical protein
VVRDSSQPTSYVEKMAITEDLLSLAKVFKMGVDYLSHGCNAYLGIILRVVTLGAWLSYSLAERMSFTTGSNLLFCFELLSVLIYKTVCIAFQTNTLVLSAHFLVCGTFWFAKKNYFLKISAFL